MAPLFDIASTVPADVVMYTPRPMLDYVQKLLDRIQTLEARIEQLEARLGIELDVRHLILYRARCAGCGRTVKPVIPPEQRAGFGPRLSALIAELRGVHGNNRRAVQDFLLSVRGLPSAGQRDGIVLRRQASRSRLD